MKSIKLTAEDIKKIIPHREPFLFVDEVVVYEEGKKGKGFFYVKPELYFFKGHFPGKPVLPGVIMVEAAAQVGACLLLRLDEFIGKIPFFAGIENVKFRRVVEPGETLEIEVELTAKRGSYGKASICGKVGSEIAFEGTISFFVKEA